MAGLQTPLSSGHFDDERRDRLREGLPDEYKGMTPAEVAEALIKKNSILLAEAGITVTEGPVEGPARDFAELFEKVLRANRLEQMKQREQGEAEE